MDCTNSPEKSKYYLTEGGLNSFFVIQDTNSIFDRQETFSKCATFEKHY